MATSQPTTAAAVEITDADGTVRQVEVPPELAQAIAEIDARERRDAKRRKREVCCTDLAGKKRRKGDDEREPLDPEQMSDGVARRVRRRGLLERGGNPWEGPRLTFTRFVGESRTWYHPPRKYEFCHGAPLGEDVYCLDCDRSGKDDLIPTVKRDDLRRLARMKDDGLKGGKG